MSALQLAAMIIGSVDTARGLEIDQAIPETWNDRPPLLQGRRRGQEETTTLLKGMIRRGVPPALRCAVWTSNVIQAVNPQQESEYWHEYRTLAKVRALDHAYETVIRTLEQAMGLEDDATIAEIRQARASYWKERQCPNYGREPLDGEDPADATMSPLPDMTESGRLALKRVLVALDYVLGLEYAPWIPVLASIFLTCMSESYAFCAIRELSHQSPYYFFPTHRREQAAWALALSHAVHRLHPHTAEYLVDRGVLALDSGSRLQENPVDGLAPIVHDFFVGWLPVPFVQYIVDIYTLEGSKVIFRFGVALLVLYKKDAAEQLTTISNAAEWWAGFKEWTHTAGTRESRFDWDLVVRKAYGVHGRGGLRKVPLRFPRRVVLQRLIRMEEDRLEQMSLDGDDMFSEGDTSVTRPLGLVVINEPDKPEEDKTHAVLAKDVGRRQQLAKWLPLSLRLTDLSLLYSTNHDGRSLDTFYRRCKIAKHTVTLCEVLQSAGEQPIVVGMYASQAWHQSTRVYGDGGCFLFRLHPSPACWKWRPSPQKGTAASDGVAEVLDDNENNQTALLEQFMVGTHEFISMGGNPDGSAGLRLNEDLTTAESSRAVGFDNEPLHGMKSSVFEVGLVEVYGLVRQMDGRSI